MKSKINLKKSVKGIKTLNIKNVFLDTYVSKIIY